MRAAVYRRFGAPEVVEVQDVPLPDPGPDGILVRVHASTVSAADHRARARDVPAGLSLPSSAVLGLVRPRRPILGMDIAGVVVAVGDPGRGYAVGDEVIAMLGSRFGGHAEFAVVRADDAIVRMPAGWGFDQAVSMVFGGITARAYLDQARIAPGTRLLVNGASGAVGSMIVQLAHAAGANVTAVTSAANQALVTRLGADEVVDYRSDDFATAGRTYDVVVDCVGNAPVARVGGIVEAGGAVLLVAADLRSLLTAKRDARRHGIAVATGPGGYRSEDLLSVARRAAEGILVPVIDRTYPLAQVASAHRYVDEGRKRGSVVLRIRAADRSGASDGAS